MIYEKTINLPKTDFPMRAELAKREPEIAKIWDKEEIYNQLRKKRAGKIKYILHDGPPYANGHIHIGTAFNKILKDIIVRYKSMQGYDAPFVPGWDCHGLPVEHQVTKNLKDKDNASIIKIRKKCREYAAKFVNIQREEFKRLGNYGEWEHPYLTMNFDYEAAIIDEFRKLANLGYIYHGVKPIYWCGTCETALAEAEVEYEDESTDSIYVKFPLTNPQEILPDSKEKTYIVIWTTTPWTLPGNTAVAIHPKKDYTAYKIENEVFIIAKELANSVFEKINKNPDKILETWEGKSLEGLTYKHPFIDRTGQIILADFVDMETGSGCVHIAPGHGEEDFEIGQKYNLPVIAPVDAKGCFTNEVELFAGQKVLEANPEIIKLLTQKNVLILSEKIMHSYPHCWRCKHPVIFRATKQWFISLNGKNYLRENALEEIKKVVWIPSWGKDRISQMVTNRPDWCISRQRAWGVPIPVFFCENCNREFIDDDTMKKVHNLVKKHGADIWFTMSAEELIPENKSCPDCRGEKFRKETDILDVWFDSGVSHAAVLRQRSGISWPADLYLEGSDQHRGWFQSSLLTSIGTEKMAPYKSVLTHGFVVDGEGKKMSKSTGNVIAPQEIIEKYGSDILRLWVTSENYQNDIKISQEILNRLTDAYRKIRNTCRYILGNLYDFNPETDKVDYNNLLEIDQFALLQLQKLLEKSVQGYNSFQFHYFYHALYNYCVNDLSAFYLDILKDRLYTHGRKSIERRSAQTVLCEIIINLAKVMAPITVHTAEEVWRNIPKFHGKETSIHLTEMPKINEEYIQKHLEENWNNLISIRKEVYSALEIARQSKIIAKSLEAKVTLFVEDKKLEAFLNKYKNELPTIFIVSSVDILDVKNKANNLFTAVSIPNLTISIEKSQGIKCERCWTWTEYSVSDKEHPNLCSKCLKIINLKEGELP
ncbi:MAG: isoleucine--tRNA ligase [bacterium]